MIRADMLFNAVMAGVASRLVIFGVGVLAVISIGFPSDLPAPPASLSRVIVELPARWDTPWYVGLASHGYRWDGQAGRFENIAFFPAHPLALGILARGLGLTSADAWNWAGVALSTAEFITALWVLGLLTEVCVGGHGKKAVWLCACSPFAVFFGLPYSESLFLLATVATFYFYVQSRHTAALISAVVSGATRPIGVVVSVALFAGWWYGVLLARRAKMPLFTTSRVLKGIVAVGPLMGMALYSAYIYGLTGSPFMWATVQAGWGRPTQNALSALISALWSIVMAPVDSVSQRPAELLNAFAATVTLALVLPIASRLGVSYAALTLLGTLVPLAGGGMASMGRYTSVLFPLYILGAWVVPQRAWPATLAIALALQAVVAAMFFSWQSMY